MNVWKFFVVFVVALGVLLGLPLMWWLVGLPGLRWVVAAGLITGGAFLVAFPFAALLAAKDAMEQQQSLPLLVEMNPMWGQLDFAIHRETPETISDMEMTWGDLEEPSGTKVPVSIALSWQQETNRALGTWWASAREMVGLKFKVHETFDSLEREAASALHTKATMRSGMRRGVQRHQAGVMDAYDSETLPEGQEFGDVFAEIEEQYDEFPKDEAATDGRGNERPEEHDPEQDTQDEQSTEDELERTVPFPPDGSNE